MDAYSPMQRFLYLKDGYWALSPQLLLDHGIKIHLMWQEAGDIALNGAHKNHYVVSPGKTLAVAFNVGHGEGVATCTPPHNPVERTTRFFAKKSLGHSWTEYSWLQGWNPWTFLEAVFNNSFTDNLSSPAVAATYHHGLLQYARGEIGLADQPWFIDILKRLEKRSEVAASKEVTVVASGSVASPGTELPSTSETNNCVRGASEGMLQMDKSGPAVDEPAAAQTTAKPPPQASGPATATRRGNIMPLVDERPANTSLLKPACLASRSRPGSTKLLVDVRAANSGTNNLMVGAAEGTLQANTSGTAVNQPAAAHTTANDLLEAAGPLTRARRRNNPMPLVNEPPTDSATVVLAGEGAREDASGPAVDLAAKKPSVAKAATKSETRQPTHIRFDMDSEDERAEETGGTYDLAARATEVVVREDTSGPSVDPAANQPAAAKSTSTDLTDGVVEPSEGPAGASKRMLGEDDPTTSHRPSQVPVIREISIMPGGAVRGASPNGTSEATVDPPARAQMPAGSTEKAAVLEKGAPRRSTINVEFTPREWPSNMMICMDMNCKRRHVGTTRLHMKEPTPIVAEGGIQGLGKQLLVANKKRSVLRALAAAGDMASLIEKERLSLRRRKEASVPREETYRATEEARVPEPTRKQDPPAVEPEAADRELASGGTLPEAL
ncbi:hypothetical protein KFL_004940130 [Klebsormidium nitens]|uniref:Uncharacterized protein n=1 Tax=Klebsormidium nitens TaxID=105231 RepID=A0A1Y1IJ70_KLENI|nr:hypothetical protein KFL_004940130 [Klebsormidium nitens]|eukprot:GAQ89181.1 hypothetical protein KFL_004940130 [Klebsormidium nitens]